MSRLPTWIGVCTASAPNGRVITVLPSYGSMVGCFQWTLGAPERVGRFQCTLEALEIVDVPRGSPLSSSSVLGRTLSLRVRVSRLSPPPSPAPATWADNSAQPRRWHPPAAVGDRSSPSVHCILKVPPHPPGPEGPESTRTAPPRARRSTHTPRTRTHTRTHAPHCQSSELATPLLRCRPAAAAPLPPCPLTRSPART